MSLVKAVAPDRADRVGLERVSTLRDVSDVPTDVVIKNLSRSGCLFQYDGVLPPGCRISLGIAGIGIREARIIRVVGTEHGCEFFAPLNETDVSTALAGSSVVQGFFEWNAPLEGEPQMPDFAPLGFSQPEARREIRLSLRLKVAIIVGATILLWGVIGGIVAALVALTR